MVGVTSGLAACVHAVDMMTTAVAVARPIKTVRIMGFSLDLGC